jgi:hypothetical protein
MAAWLDWLRSNWSLLAFLLGLGVIFVGLRTRPTEGLDSIAALDTTLHAGQPVVLDFYSNF